MCSITGSASVRGLPSPYKERNITMQAVQYSQLSTKSALNKPQNVLRGYFKDALTFFGLIMFLVGFMGVLAIL